MMAAYMDELVFEVIRDHLSEEQSKKKEQRYVDKYHPEGNTLLKK
jgi:hypothetical protein